MQWPPTSPGLNGRKFHFVPAASSTSSVSIPILWNIIASSFTLYLGTEFFIKGAKGIAYILGVDGTVVAVVCSVSCCKKDKSAKWKELYYVHNSWKALPLLY